MSETFFPINDLFRRKFQTFAVILSLALSVGSTLFLFFFVSQIGVNIFTSIGNRLTDGLSAVFSPFIIFTSVLTVASGATVSSFMISLMMSQRSKDIGLMKAAGCPSDVLFGYFLTELLATILLGCVLGIFIGLLASFVVPLFFGASSQFQNYSWNWISIAGTFGLYFVVSLVVGIKPVINASKSSPILVMSPEYRYGSSEKRVFKPVSRTGFLLKTSLRNIIRRRNASVKMLLCLCLVFTLVTIGIAGGMIANSTTTAWIRGAVGANVVLIAHQKICAQYSLLMQQFYGADSAPIFNYTQPEYIASQELVGAIVSLSGAANVEERLLVQVEVHEIQGYVLGETTQGTRVVGDNRRCQTLVVGIDPNATLGRWFLEGRQLDSTESFEVLIGDTLSRPLFSQPLLQKMKILGANYDVVGVCVDPVNNGNVSYVGYSPLLVATGISGPNLLLVRKNVAEFKEAWLEQLNATVKAIRPDFSILDLDVSLNKSVNLLTNLWSTVMLLPLFSLFGAALCLSGYVILSINEQSHEYGIMRAIGAKSKTILGMVFFQSLFVILPSFVLGVAFGIIATLMILVRGPVVAADTIFEIAGWQAFAFLFAAASSLVPAVRFARKPLIEVLRKD